VSREDLSIIIVPHDKGRSRTIKTSYRRLKIALGVSVILLIAIAGVMGHYGYLLKRADEMKGLKEENLTLRSKVSKVEDLNRRLESYEMFVKRINSTLGIGTGDTGQFTAEGSEQQLAVAEQDEEVVSINGEEALFIHSLENDIPSEWPLTRRGFVTKGYMEDANFHPGIDIAVPVNTPVRATASGFVCDLGWDAIYGSYVEIRHGESYSTMYSHNSRLIVYKGQWVRKGEIVAFSGNTGRSTAPHLHYEVRYKGVSLDPQPYLLGYLRGESEEG
jgi:murein DD-endopeptidase MepM/ murein hydrolase activator NlpD